MTLLCLDFILGGKKMILINILYGDSIWRFDFPKNHDDGHMTTFVCVRVYEEK